MITFSKDEASIYEQSWSTDSDWQRGMLTDSVSVNGVLIPQEAEGLSLPSKWEGVLPLDAIPETSIHGIYFDWEGQDFVLEASLDDVAWEVVQPRDNISIVPEDFDPTETAVLLRITFAGGEVEDPAYVSNLRAVVMLTDQITTVEGRVISFTGHSELLNDGGPEYPTDDWGLRLRSGVLTIGEDTSENATDPRTLEVWVKPVTGTALVTNFAGTSYVNGSAGSTVPNGEWSLVTKSGAAHTGDITITGDYQIGLVELHDYAMTAGEVQDSYYSYVGYPAIEVIEDSAVEVTEPASSVLIYSYDWAIIGAGG